MDHSADRTATNPFTIQRRAGAAVDLTHDDEGNVIHRKFWNAAGTAVERQQKLAWDGANRLVQVIEYRTTGAEGPGNEPNYAYRWTARYDGLGRRILAKTEWGWWITDAASDANTFVPGVIGAGTETQRSTQASANAARQRHRDTVTEESWYDPLVEFLEVAVLTRTTNAADVVASSSLNWKVHGPDANGSYGGLQGLGGLEAIYVQATATWIGIIDDYYGHTAATITDDGSSYAFVWHQTRAAGYGPRPNSPVFHLSEGSPLAQTIAWRGKRQDITGFYCMGARYYEPTSGRFLSPDPFGHAASLSLYDYAGGDPVNFVDPTGRLQKMNDERIKEYEAKLSKLPEHGALTSWLDELATSMVYGTGSRIFEQYQERNYYQGRIEYYKKWQDLYNRVANGEDVWTAHRNAFNGGSWNDVGNWRELYLAEGILLPHNPEWDEIRLIYARTAAFAELGVEIVDVSLAYAGFELAPLALGGGAVALGETRTLTYYALERNGTLAAQEGFIPGRFGHVGYSLDGGKTIFGFGPGEGWTLEKLREGGVVGGKLTEQSALFEKAKELGFQVRSINYQIDAQVGNMAFQRSIGMATGELSTDVNYALSNSALFTQPGVYNCVTFPSTLGLPILQQSGHMREVWPLMMDIGRPW